MSEQILSDLDAYDRAVQDHVRVLLFKHSPYCPISATAEGEYRRFCQEHRDVPTLFVDVVAQRATARGIADRCGVRHESPQAILFEQGRPIWHASHAAVTRGALEAAWCGGRC